MSARTDRMAMDEERADVSGPDTRSSQTYAFVAAFFEELGHSGTREVCISPGSRSTPLAVAALAEPALRCWSHLDERSAGFFALGLAKASRAPVALVCTSGTAAANYLPAVVESHYAGVPLLLLTADRPPELRDWGAGQTIDQLKLFGDHLRWFAELPVLDGGLGADERFSALLRYARSLACRGVDEARGTWPGPVHLNWPLREPLEPLRFPAPSVVEATQRREGSPSGALGSIAGSRAELGRGGRAYTETRRSISRVNSDLIESLAERAARAPRGVIVCGPMDGDAQLSARVAELASAAGWPVVADPTSQLRRGPHVEEAPILAHSDLYLRDGPFARHHRPQFVFRLGGPAVSKSLRLWLEAAPPDELVVVDPQEGAARNDPSHLTHELIRADPAWLCHALALALLARDGRVLCEGWLSDFASAEECARQSLCEASRDEAALLPPRVIAELDAGLGEGALLYVSNSMPLRHLDACMPVSRRSLRVLCNRGANGIDGMLSSALGACAGASQRAVLLTGDLAFLHDLGGLLAARRYRLDLTIVVLNNDGGSIFSFLPIAAHGEEVGFEEFFATPHQLDLGRAAALFDLEFVRVREGAQLATALNAAATRGGTTVIEVPIDRQSEIAQFRALVQRVGDLAASCCSQEVQA